MHVVFRFQGGPMDGNALHYIEENTYSGDLGAKAYTDTDNGSIGRQFTVLNPDGPTDADGNRKYREYIYETASKEELDSASLKTLVNCRYIHPAD
jgi:hypothetical protein